MSAPGLKELLDLAITAAYSAGRRTLGYFNTALDVELKADQTPVTRADREAEQLIRETILKHHPTHCILGEEHGLIEGDPDYRWIIDPIDGTKSFICGVPLYGVLIGLEIKSIPTLGVVYMPALDEMLSAATGLGCTWNGRRAGVSTTAKLSDAVLLTTSTITAISRSDAFETLASKCKIIRNWGDCYGYVLVATGRADIMLDPRINPWDCAPLLPILQEAGGHYSTWKGEPTIWGCDGLASNDRLYKQVLSIVRREELKSGWFPTSHHPLAPKIQSPKSAI